MLMNESDAMERVNSPDNLLNRIRPKTHSDIEIRENRVGNSTSRSLIPNTVKEMLGVCGKLNGIRDTATAFDVHSQTVSMFSRGIDATESLDRGLKDSVNNKVNAITNKNTEQTNTAHGLALDAMVSALTRLTTTLPEVESAKDLSKIATDMSKISANLRETIVDTHSQIKVVVFAPELKREAQYDIIDVAPMLD